MVLPESPPVRHAGYSILELVVDACVVVFKRLLYNDGAPYTHNRQIMFNVHTGI